METKKRLVDHKSEKILGYKYTPEEYELINNTLEELKGKYKTTSKAILELCSFYQNNKLKDPE